jgi:hypothetical protein
VRTSAGNSVEGRGAVSGAFSDTFSPPSIAAFASVGALLSAIKAAFSSIISGVPTREGSSGSSSITKAFSNSEGSGPLAAIPSLSFGLGFRSFDDGESVLDVDLRAEEADLDTGVPAAFWRACSSAIRESTAFFNRFGTSQLFDPQGCHLNSC